VIRTGERYLITGSDLEKLQMYSKQAKFDMVYKELAKIVDKRFVGSSSQPIRTDVRRIGWLIHKKESEKDKGEK